MKRVLHRRTCSRSGHNRKFNDEKVVEEPDEAIECSPSHSSGNHSRNENEGLYFVCMHSAAKRR
eukprot:TRINITY_DN6430_c0_g1_i1.p2 TRINITY_DN6430_c0_g1~~TRINITY_DN6430_c0_g1_i1.p2  ORF type:complete len:64 (-),score=6.12 TRINITY_DN6430_c0_g1_i1:283-474(-)